MLLNTRLLSNSLDSIVILHQRCIFIHRDLPIFIWSLLTLVHFSLALLFFDIILIELLKHFELLLHNGSFVLIKIISHRGSYLLLHRFILLILRLLNLLLKNSHRTWLHRNPLKSIFLYLSSSYIFCFPADMSLLSLSHLCLIICLFILMLLILILLLNINKLIDKTLSLCLLLGSWLIAAVSLILVDLVQNSFVLLHLCQWPNLLWILHLILVNIFLAFRIWCWCVVYDLLCWVLILQILFLKCILWIKWRACLIRYSESRVWFSVHILCLHVNDFVFSQWGRILIILQRFLSIRLSGLFAIL